MPESRFAANGDSTMRWESSISMSCGVRSQLWLTPKLRTTSSRVLVALQKFAYELLRLCVFQRTLVPAAWSAGAAALSFSLSPFCALVAISTVLPGRIRALTKERAPGRPARSVEYGTESRRDLAIGIGGYRWVFEKDCTCSGPLVAPAAAIAWG